ncbi:MAG: ribokinase [bacterium]
MKILNFGSLNIDLVYRVPHIVKPGETLSSLSLTTFAGGKGNNQSIALARAGAPVFHAGKIGKDGDWLVRNLMAAGADARFVGKDPGPTGHAVIQVADSGQNSIVLFPGANRTITMAEIRETLTHFGKGDILLLQNEINAIPDIMKAAHKVGMKIWLNPAPFDPAILKYPLSLVDLFIVNEIEAADLSGTKAGKPALAALSRQFPTAQILMTLGAKGAMLKSGTRQWVVPAPKVKAVDTTAAGDTFIGYYAASLIKGLSPEQCLTYACKAAALSVTRKGAADSIPDKKEVFG